MCVCVCSFSYYVLYQTADDDDDDDDGATAGCDAAQPGLQLRLLPVRQGSAGPKPNGAEGRRGSFSLKSAAEGFEVVSPPGFLSGGGGGVGGGRLTDS